MSILGNKIKFKSALTSYCKRCLSAVKRKYPIDPAAAEKLEVFDYKVSKKSYNRLYVWGNIQTGALGIPYLEKNDPIDKIAYVQRPKRFGFSERHEITTTAAGFGFSLFSVNSSTREKLFGCGLNTDSQIGQHIVRKGKPLEVLFILHPINLPVVSDNYEIRKISAGRAHSLVLTDEGLFLFGNNAYGQCGRAIIPEENYIESNFINKIVDLDGKGIIDIACGQDHSVAITDDGSVYSCGWGADGQTGLGHFNNTETFTRITGDIDKERIVKVACRSDFNLALNDKGEVFGWGNTEYGQLRTDTNEQQLAHPTHAKFLNKLGKITDIGTGGSFCIALNEHGEVFTWGYGLLGTGPDVLQSFQPVQIPATLFGRNEFQEDSRVCKVECGLGHMAAVTNFGDLYTWGRNRSGCLGLGHNEDQFFPLKVSISGLVKSVACGLDHTIAICKPFI